MHRIVIAVVSAVWMAGCAAAEPPAPAPQPVAEDTVAVEASEPELPLEERWRAPFAVQSRGEIPPRAPRAPVVHAGAAPAVTVAAEPEPAAAAEEDSAARATTPAPAAAARPGGNGSPPSRPEPPAPAAARSGSSSGTHRVAAGETFYGIALRYGMTFSQLQAANPGVEPDRLRVGQELRVPRSGAGGSSAAPASRSAARRTHTVVAGETLWGIARRYGVAAERIRAANSMEGDRVRVGQTLVIPGAE